MAKICFISPHLDDAILSCGIQILRHVRAGDDVEVISVFTEGDAEGHKERRKEDIMACAILGARHTHLGFYDAPYRNSRYTSIEQIVFGTMDDQDTECIRIIAAQLDDVLSSIKPERIYMPLAAGHHIDHRLVWCTSQILALSDRVIFYEDKPYVLWPGILETRLNEIGITRDELEVTSEEMKSSINNYYFLQTFVPIGVVRNECLPLYISKLADSRKKFPDKLKAESFETNAQEEELEKIWSSLSMYRSQTPHIYRSFKDLCVQGSYRERYWIYHF